MLYVENNVDAVERRDMSRETIKENIWCEIQLNRLKMLVGVCYRVPDATEEADRGMCKLLEMANKGTSLIMGDFHYHIDWGNLEEERGKIFCYIRKYCLSVTLFIALPWTITSRQNTSTRNVFI